MFANYVKLLWCFLSLYINIFPNIYVILLIIKWLSEANLLLSRYLISKDSQVLSCFIYHSHFLLIFVGFLDGLNIWQISSSGNFPHLFLHFDKGNCSYFHISYIFLHILSHFFPSVLLQALLILSLFWQSYLETLWKLEN